MIGRTLGPAPLSTSNLANFYYQRPPEFLDLAVIPNKGESSGVTEMFTFLVAVFPDPDPNEYQYQISWEMVDENNKVYLRKPLHRKRIWELEKTWLCSIIGTCLSMHEARKIGRKFGAKCSDPTQIDAVIHSMLVRDCAEKNQISTHVNKILEKKSL